RPSPLAIDVDAHRAELKELGQAAHHRHQVDVSVGNVNSDNSFVDVHVLAIDFKRFAREEVSGNRVAAERIEHEHVEPLRACLCEVAFQGEPCVAQYDVDL